MAFLRIEKKKSGQYLRVVESYRENGKPKHRTLYSMGKVEDYPSDQLERIATKLLELSGNRIEDVIVDELKELRRVNYGYALVIKKLWKQFNLDAWVKQVNSKHRVRFNWLDALELMIAERINEPVSKHASYHNQEEYIGLSKKSVPLHHFYRCLDLLSKEQKSLKRHLFQAQQDLFSEKLDVVFYDVTTLYFDSQKEQEGNLRQKGYSKDGKAHKTQVVLGLLIDKLRNPISYHIYEGNTYEGKTMLDALSELKKEYKIDNIVVVADSGMIDRKNRLFMEKSSAITYVLGDRLKNLPQKISATLIDKDKHQPLSSIGQSFTYATSNYQGRKIICTYSEKRARKDANAREKLIEKAKQLLKQPSKLKNTKKRGSGRYISQLTDEKYELDIKKIEQDKKWDGFKAIATTTNLSTKEVLAKYADLFEVEHAFRALKSQLQIRPIFHWTNKRIEGHIAMCFMAYTFLNHIRNAANLQYKNIIKALDSMQLSEVKDKKTGKHIYLRSKISQEQQTLIKKLSLVVPKDTTPQKSINQIFI